MLDRLAVQCLELLCFRHRSHFTTAIGQNASPVRDCAVNPFKEYTRVNRKGASLATAEQDLVGKQLGAYLRKTRENLGLSLDNVAGRADMSTSGLWLIEQGRRMPSAFTLSKIAHALGIEGSGIETFIPLRWEPMPQGLPGLRLVVGTTRTSLQRAA